MTEAQFRSIAGRHRKKTLVHLELGDDGETVVRAEIHRDGKVLFRFPKDANPLPFPNTRGFVFYGRQWDDFKILKENDGY